MGRTFIEPKTKIRHFGVKVKLNPVKELLAGKRVILIDDSIVRGTTSRKIVKMVRAAGAKEVHMRISCPPIRNACYFGVDFPDPKDLVATNRTVEEIRAFLNVDSLHYLSIEGMLQCVSRPKSQYCHACFSGEYRLEINRPVTKLSLERHQLKMFT